MMEQLPGIDGRAEGDFDNQPSRRNPTACAYCGKTECEATCERVALWGNPYHKGEGAMPTEVESAREVMKESDPQKPLKVGGAGHRVLREYGSGRAMTAYEASFLACGNHHGKRRESRRLYERGYLELLPYTMKNPAPEGRPRVEGWRITQAGLDWLKAHPWPS